ncbi:MAG: hypothetical protein DRP10_02495 [Candidatus Aenigmatarchaeota archaeon]|nr:MAG: hypothetical protein DRP10_02495 [Candidatus Aenigmarchaeota archaeon]
MNKELFFDIIWIIIAIVCGFCLIILSNIWFGTSNLSKLLNYFGMFMNLFSGIYNKFTIILVIICFIIILFLLGIGKLLRE